jgi:hypothetical protein
MDELNDDWIQKFVETDDLYKDFYKDDIFFTNLYFIYIDKNNEIEKIKNETFILNTPNYISREEIIKILKKNSYSNNEAKKYSLLSILKYNFFLNPEEIISFLKCDNQDLEYYNKKFFLPVKNIDNIYFEKSITMFEDLNDLFFLFHEKNLPEDVSHNITKKIHMKQKQKQKHLNSKLLHNKTIKK